jgi:asparagine synthase (glutamine-hydrolysing)
MCGISGFVSPRREPFELGVSHVAQMNDYMRSRGPDASRVWSGAGSVLGHRRLSILDLDARSDQPMISRDGNFIIVFNGEIYNYRELRLELELVGVVLKTTSDTEVILELFSREGIKMLPRLRGMFAIAIWDIRAHELWLARDPYGIKPLYYSSCKEGLLFASQVKALLTSNLISRDLEPAGLAGFFLWGNVPEPWTLYRNVFSLPAGHWLRFAEGGAITLKCWHDIRNYWQAEGHPISGARLGELVRSAVTSSVKAHLISDVPVCVFLSGGIDSGAIAGLLGSSPLQAEAITIKFDEFSGRVRDESSAASLIANRYALKHHVRGVSRLEFEECIPAILKDMDQPSVDGVNTWFACKAAAERGYKVALSGIGGDELFFGYPSFSQIPRAAMLGRIVGAIPGLSSALEFPFKSIAQRKSQIKYGSIPKFMDSIEGLYFLQRCLFLPVELPGMIGEGLALEGLARLGGDPPGVPKTRARSDGAAVGLLESTFYLRNQLLRDSDWASMAHSVELRTPLVDVALLGAVAPYVDQFKRNKGKRMLARAPDSPLPSSIANAPKLGFGVPMHEWFESIESGADAARCATNITEPWARRWARILVEKSIGT